MTIRQRRGSLQGPDRGPGGRHPLQPHGPLEYLGPEEAGGPRHRLRAVDAGFAPLGRVGRGVLLQPRRHPAAGRRAQPAADPVRAAGDAALPLGPRVCPPVYDGQRAASRTKPDVLILAPGPINRGVEVTPDVADGPQSAILDQVTNGVAVRMAVLWLLCKDKG